MENLKTIDTILIGLGNVGKGFLQILINDKERLAREYGIALRIVAISNLRYGNFVDPNGFDPQALLSALEDQDMTAFESKRSALSTEEMIANTKADYLLEASATNFEDAEPANTYCRAALMSGKHLVTANKGPVALFYKELLDLAQENNVQIGVEGTVMSGTPTMRLGMDILRSANINKIQGILNGTTNYILTKMAEGNSYESAVQEAYELGYADANPVSDVEGFDAAGKVVILSNLLMDADIQFSEVDRNGITKLTIEDIENAKNNDATWKLIGTIEKTPSGLNASVKPIMLPNSHPLTGVSGGTNAITFSTEIMGDITLIGAGAGRVETGYALLNDVILIERSNK